MRASQTESALHLQRALANMEREPRQLAIASARWLLSLWALLGVGGSGRALPARRSPAVSGPTRFYAVSHTFWDNGPMWDYHILEAEQDGTDTVVRDLLITSVQSPCGPSCTVKAKTKRLQNTRPAELVGDNNPCAVDRRELRREIRRTRRALKYQPLFSTADFGVVATCGGEETVLHLPLLPFPFQTQGSRPIVRSYDLLPDVETRVFGTGKVFRPIADMKTFKGLQDDSESKDQDDERVGETFVAELRSGAFDRALWGDCKKPACTGEGLKQVLETYVPPEERSEPGVSWVSSPVFECLNCPLPAYPPIAKLARVEGDVELEIQVDGRTGAVLRVAVTSGQSLLVGAAIQAAQVWQFRPERHLQGVKRSRVKLRFRMNCFATRFPAASQ